MDVWIQLSDFEEFNADQIRFVENNFLCFTSTKALVRKYRRNSSARNLRQNLSPCMSPLITRLARSQKNSAMNASVMKPAKLVNSFHLLCKTRTHFPLTPPIRFDTIRPCSRFPA